jgi:hypothetical protein
MKLYKHAIAYKWTAEELIATIKLIKSTDFKVEDEASPQGWNTVRSLQS